MLFRRSPSAVIGSRLPGPEAPVTGSSLLVGATVGLTGEPAVGPTIGPAAGSAVGQTVGTTVGVVVGLGLAAQVGEDELEQTSRSPYGGPRPGWGHSSGASSAAVGTLPGLTLVVVVPRLAPTPTDGGGRRRRVGRQLATTRWNGRSAGVPDELRVWMKTAFGVSSRGATEISPPGGTLYGSVVPMVATNVSCETL
ncbi:hypothetical protein GA0070606_1908 [Micromonospora citrea]|uniref:Uncharacterized protein n=1 Tax=Micromonospora citrea TaxID=47855 RepID=A0A1C6UDI3_9ACTN|nr:hypothetical protein GA0070606_1908 [Micromonospora citrea]